MTVAGRGAEFLWAWHIHGTELIFINVPHWVLADVQETKTNWTK